jgi:hypothetical protein
MNDVMLKVKLKNIVINDRACDKLKINPWCVNEGADGEALIDVSLSDVLEFNILVDHIPNAIQPVYQHRTRKVNGSLTMSHWVDYDFESSARNTPEFLQFARELKYYSIQELADECSLMKFNVGHFYVSSFWRLPDGTIFYVSIPDVRYNRWSTNVLFRSAKTVDDYVGGENHYCCIGDIADIPSKISKE